MVQTRENRTSAGLGERCPIHGCGLNFFSSKEQGFKCLSCLINKDDVQYIDKSYIGSLENFKKISEETKQLLLENAEAILDLSRWKEDIRDMVMRVRDKFLSYIEEFTLQLKKNLIDIENQQLMKDFIGEDRRQEYRLKNLEEKLSELDTIILTIEETPRHLKA